MSISVHRVSTKGAIRTYASADEDCNSAALRSAEVDAKPGSENQDLGSDRSLGGKGITRLGTHQSSVHIDHMLLKIRLSECQKVDLGNTYTWIATDEVKTQRGPLSDNFGHIYLAHEVSHHRLMIANYVSPSQAYQMALQ